jgi:hypothetical protein
MSLIEKARAKVAEIQRGGLVSRTGRLGIIEAFPKLKEIRGGGKLLGQVPILDEIRSKGAVGTIQERFPALRGQGLFTAATPTSQSLFRAVTPTSQKPGIVEDVYVEPLKKETSRSLSVQM